MTSPPASERGEPLPDLDGPVALELLGDAVERAWVVARRDDGDREAPAPPPSLRPVLRFSKLPERARRTILEALDDDAFRRRVADSTPESDLEPAAALFLHRPPGWAEELSLLVDAAGEEAERARTSEREREAVRRLQAADAAAEKLRDELADLRTRAARAEERSQEMSRRVAELEAQLRAEEVHTSELDAARSEAVRQLKTTESLAAERLEEVRDLRGQVERLRTGGRGRVAAGPEGPTARPAAAGPADTTASTRSEAGAAGSLADTGASGTGSLESARVAAAAEGVARAAAAASQLTAALEDVGRSLREGPGGAASEDESGTGGRPGATPDAGGRARRGVAGAPPTGPRRSGGGDRARRADRPPRGAGRRVPVRLHRGATEDDPVGLRQLLDTPGAVVLVDGWNVSMAGWPAATGAQQRDRLVSAVGALRTAADSVHLVFDGDDDGGRPAVSTPLPVRVHFSPGDTEADDVILGMVADLPATTPVVVVSSDGRVRRGAREHGANVAPSEALLALLGR